MKIISLGIRGTLRIMESNRKVRKRRQQTNKYISYYLDELSKGLIQARLAYSENHELKELLISYISLGYDTWEIPELDIYSKDKIFYLFGEGDRYEYCALLLKYSKYSKRYRIIGTDISAWENAAASDAVLVSIMPDKVLQGKRNKELQNKYPERIVHVTPWSGILLGVWGWQYFDVFSPRKDEVFVNAGAFQGETDIDFVKWTGGSYKKIYAFEPMKDNVEICKKRYVENNINNIEIFSKGTWSETGYIAFSEGDNQGRIDENGANRVETIKIDDAMRNGGGHNLYQDGYRRCGA